MAEIEHPADNECRNCGYPLTGPYCSACGQSVHDGHPPTLGHFFHDLLHEFLHVDGTIFRTLKALFLQPGRLTEEYWAGHIVPWVRPVRIFLIVVALHLLVSTGVGPLNFQLVVTKNRAGDLQLGVLPSHAQSVPVGSMRVPEEQRRAFFEQFEKAYAEIRYSSVLLFAAAAWLLYRKRQPYFVANLILALHFYSFWYALAMISDLLAGWHPVLGDLSLLSVVYLYLALGRLFHERWFLRLAKVIALYVFMLATELGLGIAAGLWSAHRVAH